MPKNKLKKFNEYQNFTNTFDARNQLKGKWKSEVFKNNHPIVLELACGRGEYTLGLAELYPDKNFIGIDVKTSRMWLGAKTAIESNRSNVAFLRIQIDFLTDYFESGEVEEIWITFPDPQPQKPRERQRLTSDKYLEKYKTILGVEKKINLKTDSDFLFNYSLQNIKDKNIQITQVVMNIDDLDPMPDELKIKTYYERMWREQGITIKYLQFQFI
jgi:tRNA (guanine-N7-)-methyltransferase